MLCMFRAVRRLRAHTHATARRGESDTVVLGGLIGAHQHAARPHLSLLALLLLALPVLLILRARRRQRQGHAREPWGGARPQQVVQVRHVRRIQVRALLSAQWVPGTKRPEADKKNVRGSAGRHGTWSAPRLAPGHGAAPVLPIVLRRAHMYRWRRRRAETTFTPMSGSRCCSPW